jgi:hypothetical protein
MKRTILSIVIGLVVVVIIAASIFYFKLNSIIKRTVEAQASESLDLKTSVDSAHFSLFGGKLALDGVAVASPQGFSAPQMLWLDEGNVAVKYGQLRDDPIRIPSLTLDKPRLLIEQAGGKLNFQGLVQKQQAAKGEKPLLLIIDTLTIRNATVVLRPGLPGLEKEITIPIPNLTLHNIGNADGNSNGAALKQVVTEVVTALVNQSTQAGNVPDMLKGMLRDQARQVEQEVLGRIRNVTDQLDKNLKGVGGDQVDKVSGQLDKLLGGSKDKK